MKSMERKRYIELMCRRSVGDEGAKVMWRGGEYYPTKYELWYAKGEVKHSAVLQECNGRRCLVYVLLSEVEEAGGTWEK